MTAEPRAQTSEPVFPGAVAPERAWTLRSHGVDLRLHEWGDADAPPLLLCHGMFDHARGFDVLAPLLAAEHRVIGLDARGHGDSAWTDTYTWMFDAFDIVNALRAIERPAVLVGHSKGGGQSMEAALLAPGHVTHLVNIDGFGPPDDGGYRPVDESLTTPERCARFLDRRRAAAQRLEWRPYPTLDDLVARRAAQNPRLSDEWVRYFVYHGARESDDGWRWKADPQTTAGEFGPWEPRWIGLDWHFLAMPTLAMIGSEADVFATPRETLDRRLSSVPKLARATIEGAGHFVHMERPTETAAAILDFVAGR